MGTRHLICVFVNGEYKLAQYGQWDGYPDGQGVDILDFLHKMDRNKFLENLKKTRFISDEEYKDLWKKSDILLSEDGLVSLEDHNKFSKMYPSLCRDTSANVLRMIESLSDLPAGEYNKEDYHKELPLTNAIDFAGDSLFCEWAYVIDFDKNVFEVYRGFNKEPLNEKDRFYGFPKESRNTDYRPIKLAASFDLNNLPEESVFLETLTEKDENEEDKGDEQ